MRAITAADLAYAIDARVAILDPEAWLAARPDLTMTAEVAALCRRYVRALAEYEAAEAAIYEAGGVTPRREEERCGPEADLAARERVGDVAQREADAIVRDALLDLGATDPDGSVTVSAWKLGIVLERAVFRAQLRHRPA